MLRRAKELHGYHLGAIDGEIGSVKDFYFDDTTFTVRYLVAETGTWLAERQVLISPHALHPVDTENKLIPVALTREQIENSPSADTDRPISKRFEIAYFSYHGWPVYWQGPFLWGPMSLPGASTVETAPETQTSPAETDPIQSEEDPHLRNTESVTGYHIQALDGEIGHVDDFIIDDESWAIRYLIVDTRNWWPGKKVLVSPRWIDAVSWEEAKVVLHLSREAVKQEPPYSEEALLRLSEQSRRDDLHEYRLGDFGPRR